MYEEDLVLYYYDETEAADRYRIEQHLSECVTCRAFVDELRGLLPRLAKSQELPATFWQNYYRETIAKLNEQEARRHRWREWFMPMKSWFAPAFGAAAVAVFALGMLFAKGSWPLLPAGASVKLPQEVMADGEQLEFFRELDMLESMNELEARDGVKRESESNRLHHSGLPHTAA
jgi:hypothetical protein